MNDGMDWSSCQPMETDGLCGFKHLSLFALYEVAAAAGLG